MFYLYNFDKSIYPKDVDSLVPESCFVMETCQRKMIIAADAISEFTNLDSVLSLESDQAYQYLLEVVCGLKSRLVAENEIVSQYRISLSQYLALEHRDSRLLTILQKVLKDHKVIRASHLKGISQRTYAAITKKEVLRANANVENILIWGSGSLAEDLINQFKKKANVYICARNTGKVQELVEKHNVKAIEWMNFQEASKISIQINTIGTDEEIFGEVYLNHLGEKSITYFADLSNPSPLSQTFKNKFSENSFLNLDQVFNLGAVAVQEKNKKINQAIEKIKILSKHRISLLNKKNNYIAEQYV